MPSPYFHDAGGVFRAEQIRAMTIAFEQVLTKLALNRSDDEANDAAEVIASEVATLSAAGEHDPERLCAGVLESLRRYGEAIVAPKRRA